MANIERGVVCNSDAGISSINSSAVMGKNSKSKSCKCKTCSVILPNFNKIQHSGRLSVTKKIELLISKSKSKQPCCLWFVDVSLCTLRYFFFRSVADLCWSIRAEPVIASAIDRNWTRLSFKRDGRDDYTFGGTNTHGEILTSLSTFEFKKETGWEEHTFWRTNPLGATSLNRFE